MIVDRVFYSMEKEAMEMLIACEVNEKDILIEQYNNAIVCKREFTGSGFYTHYTVPANARKLKNLKKQPIGTVYGDIKGLELGVGFILFFNNGNISMLECYENDSILFPDKIINYKLYYEKL